MYAQRRKSCNNWVEYLPLPIKQFLRVRILTMVERRIVTTRVLPYVYKHLDSGRTLSSLLKTIDLSKGEFWTYIPSNINEEDIYNLSCRGTMSLLKPHIQNLVVEMIQDFLLKDTSSFCVLEDALAFPTDPFLLDIAYPKYCSFGNDVYYYLSVGDADQEKIKLAISRSKSFLLTAVLTTVASDIHFRPKAQLKESDLRTIIDGLKKIIMSSYDGQGYLIWSREK